MYHAAAFSAATSSALAEPVIVMALTFIGLLGLLLALALSVGIYVYFALALSRIGRNHHQRRHWLAWIPVANLFLFPMIRGKKWYWGFLFFVPVVNVVFLTICLWELLEKSGREGKWSMILLGWLVGSAPAMTIVTCSFLVMIGIVAWKKK